MDDEDEDVVEVTTCQGAPICMLQMDEAIAAAQAGCRFCVRQFFVDGQPAGMIAPTHA